jgi:hypothetical protein
MAHTSILKALENKYTASLTKKSLQLDALSGIHAAHQNETKVDH